MSILRKSSQRTSSRSQIAIRGVENGILELPDKQYRLILHVSSINFELKSEAEQDALIDTYQAFLNSLGWPIQLLIRVREMDMDKYLSDFAAKVEDETESIYRQQIKNYTQFVSQLITKGKILSRHCYVIVGHDSDDNDRDLVIEQLHLHADIVSKGLARLGMRTRKLESMEVLDLFYSFYSPVQAKRQPLTDRTLKLLQEAYL